MVKHKICKILSLFLIHNVLYGKAHGQTQKGSFDHNDSNDEFEGCYADNMNPYLLFSTKTSYKTVVKNEQHITDPPAGCSPEMIWVLVRHGTRYTVRIEEFYELYKIRDEIIYNFEHKKNVELCEKDIENLRKWYFTMVKEQENHIHQAGLEESKIVAKRLRSKFPELIKPPYIPGKYIMKVTNTSTAKTLVSGKAFMEEMFPSSPIISVYPATEDDLLVKIYTPCINNMAKKTYKAMLKDFHESAIYKRVQTNVMQRLGLNSLLPKNMDKMYKMCRFDKAWNYDKVSPWCSVFSQWDLKVLEYYQDYKYYIKSGYGSKEFSKKLGCPLVQDMIMRFKDINDGITGNQPNAIFYMAHSTTVNTLLVGLGIANDEEALTIDNFKKQNKRKWRSSYNGPYGANLVAVFYRCKTESNKVIIYLNEKPVQIEGCEGLMCSFETFYEKYKDYIEKRTCNVNELCKEEFNFWFYILCASIGTGFVFFVKFFLNLSLTRKNVFCKYTKYFRFRNEENKHIV